MKEYALSFIETIKDDILSVNRSLYEFKEDCFKEEKSVEHIIELLKKYGFNVEKDILGIPNAFKGTLGSGQPNICFICKYSTGDNAGHIYGNNSNAAMSLGSCIGLSSIMNKMSGTITIFGCPGKYSNGSEIIMEREGLFEDSSIIFAPHADNITSLYNSSLSAITYEIHYSNFKANELINMSALDFCLQTVHFINRLIENTESTCYMDHLHLYCDNAINEYPTSAVSRFELKGKNYSICNVLGDNIRKYLKCVEEIMNVKCDISLVELPSKELIESGVVNRIFEGNLKESGIIKILCHNDVLYPLGVGTVSHSTPTIYPSIDIIGSKTIDCPSEAFRDATILSYAEENIIKAVKALSCTAIDFLERPDLIIESTSNLNDNLNLNKKA